MAKPGDPITAFISYSYTDRKLGHDVKDELSGYGIRCFLAHDDIKPSAQWVREIRRALRTCDVFLPILTDDFHQSKWTDQEVGWALSRNILIVPLKVTVTPYGFLGAYQAVKCDATALGAACTATIDALLEQKPQLHPRFIEGFIPVFADSSSFDEAGRRARVLQKCRGYTQSHVRKIARATIDNRQIHGSRTAHDSLARFLTTHSSSGPVTREALKKMGVIDLS